MKYLYFICFVFCTIHTVLSLTPEPRRKNLLGSKECTWGPSYWCSNLTAAAGCRAVNHCIQTVWEHQTLPPDTDTVCETCLKMVKQARDQLLSNETEEEIQEVFEGSCKLIPVKIVNEECCKLVDEFIPELVDTLASQMNPQVVCSVAGLCNSARVDDLLEKYEEEKTPPPISTCDGCHTVVDILEKRLNNDMSKDDVLQSFLRLCGQMGSFSDACSSIVITHFTEIYQHLRANFNSDSVCLLSGECTAQFHTHAVEVTPLSKIGYVPIRGSDDLPCELCEQLVTHLRDILIANTTELEFEKVLLGICNQTGNFKSECQSLVDQYTPLIYQFLLQELNSTVSCQMIGICPTQLNTEAIPIVPLLPVDTAPKAYDLINDNEDDLNRVNVPNKGLNVKIISRPELMQLPIERLFPKVPEMYNRQVCIFCQYFLHYVQSAITDPATEEEIKKVIESACDKLPSSVNATCVEFVDTYEEAAVALLAQQIDPSVICPTIRACPSSDVDDGYVEVFYKAKDGKDKCPLCLFAVTELEEMVKDKNTKTEIEDALDKLCLHFSGSIAEECKDFVSQYTDNLVEMLLSHLKPQEVCEYLKLCNTTVSRRPFQPVKPTQIPKDVDILTNEIPDSTINGKFSPAKSVEGGQSCILCEFAMDKLQKMLENKTTEDEIKKEVMSICTHLPRSVSAECTNFVKKYADVVIQLLIASVQPDQICAYMGLCPKKSQLFENPIIIDIPAGNFQDMEKPVASPQCYVCKLIMAKVEKFIIGPKTKEEIIDGLDDICEVLPRSEGKSCIDFVTKHGDTIADMLLAFVQPDEICSALLVCSDLQNNMEDVQDVKAIGSPQCTLCKLIVTAVDKIIINPTTKSKIVNDMYEFCDIVPRSDKNPCIDFVAKYGDTIAELIIQAVQPSEICMVLFICSDIKDMIQDEITECSFCEAVYFNFNYMKQTHGKILPERVCKSMTDKYIQPCLDLLEKHAFAMSMYSSTDTDTTAVCEELEYCKGPSQFVRTRRSLEEIGPYALP